MPRGHGAVEAEGSEEGQGEGEEEEGWGRGRGTEWYEGCGVKLVMMGGRFMCGG